jgi:hypothetical protein
VNEYLKQLYAEVDAAARFEHPKRKMRITLECGHYRLMEAHLCVAGGIGWSTVCKVCPDGPSRVIVNQEETGVL